MVNDPDFGGITVREILEKKLGKKTSDKIIKEVNNAYKQGKRGEELRKLFNDILAREGHDKPDFSLGLVIAIP
jgi:hypothetical protein